MYDSREPSADNSLTATSFFNVNMRLHFLLKKNYLSLRIIIKFIQMCLSTKLTSNVIKILYSKA